MPDALSTTTNSLELLTSESEKRFIGPILNRTARAVCISLVIVASLLSYPSVVTWMIAFWLLWQTVARARGKPGHLQLLTCLVVLLAKRIYWAPGIMTFFVAALVMAVWYAVRSGKTSSFSYLNWIAPLSLWGLWAFLTLEWQAIARCSHPVNMNPGGCVICVGNSLTSGLLPDRGYPEQLKKLIQLPVVNMGQSGRTTEGGLSQLPRIKEANPLVVVIELGGHDFLKGRSRAATKKNLELMITACREMGSEVVLMEIPRGFITDPFAGLEREIAHEKDLELIPDSVIRQLVIWSPILPPGVWMPRSRLSDDGIHTNALGSKFMARNVAEALQRMYGEQVRTGGP